MALGVTLSDRDGDHVVANASVREYQEITADNADAFHVHGDVASFPLTGVIAVPPDRKSRDLLLGRYLSAERVQLIAPIDVVGELLETVFSIQNVVIAALVLVGTTTLGLVTLVFLLSLRLRRREIETMMKIGGSRLRITATLSVEIVGVLAAGVIVAAGLTWAAGGMGTHVVQRILSG